MKQPRPRHVRLPHDRFTWAVLQVQPGRAARSRDRLAGLAAQRSPQSDGQEVDLIRIDRNRVLVCGLPPHEYHRLVSAEEAPPLSLGPSSLPTFVPSVIDPDRIDICRAASQARRRHERRRSSRIVLLVTLWLVALLATAGIARRVSSARAGIDSLARQLTDLEERAGSLIPPEFGSTREIRPQDLMAAIQRLSSEEVHDPPLDVSHHLASILSKWPIGVRVDVLTLLIDARQCTVSCRVEDRSIIDEFTDAWTQPDTWSAETPTMYATSDGLRLDLTVTREQSP